LEIHPTPACNATRVTLAPTDDGALRLNWYPAMGNMLVPTPDTDRTGVAQPDSISI
jgi:hypothetical protein